MSTPIDEKGEPTYSQQQPTIPDPNVSGARRSQDTTRSREQHWDLPRYNIHSQEGRRSHEQPNSDEEGTVVGNSNEDNYAAAAQPQQTGRPRANTHLTVDTEYDHVDRLGGLGSPSQTRERSKRLEDDLMMVQVERQVSKAADEEDRARRAGNVSENGEDMYRSRSRRGGRNDRDELVDEFDIATNPVHEKTATYKPPENPTTGFSKFVKKIHTSGWLIRYFTYIVPVVALLLIPLLLGALAFPNANVGGVELMWFSIWLVIVWLTLWAGRILAKCLPWPMGVISSLFTNNGKKWRDLGKALELPATLFFWWLAIEISFLPTMTNHMVDGNKRTEEWMSTMNKVLVTIFIASILNFVEKIIIQLIAISFHLRTYADRIEINKFQIQTLTKLYTYSKDKIAMEDSDFEAPSGQPGSGTRTPGQFLNEAAKTTKKGITKFGDVAGKVAGDFTGKATMNSQHPHQVTLTLLSTTPGAQVLARRLYRTFAREGDDEEDEQPMVHSDDLKHAFDSDGEAEAAFSMFDKDMNGNISMEELEAVCVEIGRERKSITASLKDLDSVVSKLDDCFMFIVFVIVILVFISLISTSAAGVLTSAGSAVLALSWLFSATAQEFLQSLIFVFVKHPFDVGDRVSVYGNTGDLGRGDDYFVKEISLLYTEFKKLQGHVVQAPNSYLNTLFILNQRRSGGLAEAVPITFKFGTTLEQIDGLRERLLEYVTIEKREFQPNILTEVREVMEVHSVTMNIVFFYKSNWQNEGLRLARRNKFICAMMACMQDLGIEGPRMRYPGLKESFPVYMQSIPHIATPGMGHGGNPDNPGGMVQSEPVDGEAPFVDPQQDPTRRGSVAQGGAMRTGSILRGSNNARGRGESLNQAGRRVDFSLGASALASGDMQGDVYETRQKPRVPINITSPSPSGADRRRSNDIARSTSHDAPVSPGGLARRSTTDSGGSRFSRHHLNVGGGSHRNRFFGRSRPGTSHNDEQGLMESGMADIPENPSTSGSNEPSQRRESQGAGRMDPRSGMVSPAAWRLNTNDSNLHPSAPQEEVGDAPPQLPQLGHGVARSQTEDFGHRQPGEDYEMKRL
ncbi:hypothetical protein MBLNU230_g5272t1 [Neophaeotheca triangularis]